MKRIIALSFLACVSITQCASTKELKSTNIFPYSAPNSVTRSPKFFLNAIITESESSESERNQEMEENMGDRPVKIQKLKWQTFMKTFLSESELKTCIMNQRGTDVVCISATAAVCAGSVISPVCAPFAIYCVASTAKSRNVMNKLYKSAHKRYLQDYEWHEGIISGAPARVIVPRGTVSTRTPYDCYTSVHDSMLDITKSINEDVQGALLPGFSTQRKKFSIRSLHESPRTPLADLESSVDEMMDSMIMILGRNKDYNSLLSSGATYATLNLKAKHSDQEQKKLLQTHYDAGNGVMLTNRVSNDRECLLNSFAPVRLAVLTNQWLRLMEDEKARELYIDTLPKLKNLVSIDIPLFMSVAAIKRKALRAISNNPGRESSEARASLESSETRVVKDTLTLLNIDFDDNEENFNPEQFLQEIATQAQNRMNAWEVEMVSKGSAQNDIDSILIVMRPRIANHVKDKDFERLYKDVKFFTDKEESQFKL